MANYAVVAPEAFNTLACNAYEANKDYVRELIDKYDNRQKARKSQGTPVVAFCGWGRSGKDTAAQWWCRTSGLTYVGSASRIVLPLVAHMAGDDEEHCYAVRHDNKEFWIEACHALRRLDLTLLVRMALGAGDVLVGVRCGKELHEARRLGMFDYSYWISRQVPRDKTVEYGERDCDAVLDNNGAIGALYERIERLYRFVSGRFKQ